MPRRRRPRSFCTRAARGSGGLEDLEDAVRVARSRGRMAGRDADYHNGALSLDPWRLPWQ